MHYNKKDNTVQDHMHQRFIFFINTFIIVAICIL